MLRALRLSNLRLLTKTEFSACFTLSFALGLLDRLSEMGFLKKVVREVKRVGRQVEHVTVRPVAQLVHGKKRKQYEHALRVTSTNVEAGVVVVTDGKPQFVAPEDIQCEHDWETSEEEIQFVFSTPDGTTDTRLSDTFCSKCSAHKIAPTQ